MESFGCFLLRGTSKVKLWYVVYGIIKSIAFNALTWIILTTEKAVHKIFDLTGSREDSSTQTQTSALHYFHVQTSITADVWGFYKFSTHSCKARGNTHIPVHATCFILGSNAAWSNTFL